MDVNCYFNRLCNFVNSEVELLHNLCLVRLSFRPSICHPVISLMSPSFSYEFLHSHSLLHFFTPLHYSLPSFYLYLISLLPPLLLYLPLPPYSLLPLLPLFPLPTVPLGTLSHPLSLAMLSTVDRGHLSWRLARVKMTSVCAPGAGYWQLSPGCVGQGRVLTRECGRVIRVA